MSAIDFEYILRVSRGTGTSGGERGTRSPTTVLCARYVYDIITLCRVNIITADDEITIININNGAGKLNYLTRFESAGWIDLAAARKFGATLTVVPIPLR